MTVNMSRLASIRTSDQRSSMNDRNLTDHIVNSCRPGSAASATAGCKVSVDDLLEHTWHYQCVVSPTFSAAALATALVSASNHCDPPLKGKVSMSNSAAAAGSDHGDFVKKLHLKFSRAGMHDYQSAADDLLRIRNDLLEARGAVTSNDDDDDHPLPLLRLRRERIAASTANADRTDINQDGYVSLASFINNTASSDTSPTAETPHKAFDLFNFRKHINNKPTSRSTTLKTCRDKERRSAVSRAGDPSRISFYAGYLTVD